jgi:hypothetical protein
MSVTHVSPIATRYCHPGAAGVDADDPALYWPAPVHCGPAQFDGVRAAATDWYANLLWIERRKCLLVTHAGTLFSVFVPDVRAANLRPIGPLVVPLIQAELVADGLSADALGALEATEVVVARTADRSVLGSMNDMALMIESSVWADGGLPTCNVTELNRHLRRHLSGARGYKPPIELARGWKQRAD